MMAAVLCMLNIYVFWIAVRIRLFFRKVSTLIINGLIGRIYLEWIAGSLPLHGLGSFLKNWIYKLRFAGM